MKKIKNNIVKSLSIILCIGILVMSLPFQAVQAATETPKNQIEQLNISDNGVI